MEPNDEFQRCSLGFRGCDSSHLGSRTHTKQKSGRDLLLYVLLTTHSFLNLKCFSIEPCILTVEAIKSSHRISGISLAVIVVNSMPGTVLRNSDHLTASEIIETISYSCQRQLCCSLVHNNLNQASNGFLIACFEFLMNG